MANGISSWKANNSEESIHPVLPLGVVLLLASGVGCSNLRQTESVAFPADAAIHVVPSVIYEECMEGLPQSGMWKCDPVFGDVNGDGLLDLAAIERLGHGPRVWLGQANGGWVESSAGLTSKRNSCGGGVCFGDVDGDGRLDLAVADHCYGLFVYLGDGDGHWDMVTEGLCPPGLQGPGATNQMLVGAEDVALGDVNGDGWLDLLAGSSDEGGINLYLGDGTGSHWKWVNVGLPTSGWANRVMFSDVDGDGTLDIVASYCEGPRVWLNDGRGVWTAASEGFPQPMIRGLYTGIAVHDVNADGLSDIAAANWVDGPEVYLQQYDGSWQKAPDVFPAMLGGAVGIALGIVDRDQHADLVVVGRLAPNSGYVRGVFLLKGDSAGGWHYISDCGLPDTGLAATAGVTLADVNGDGRLDVAAASGLIVETVAGQTGPAIACRLPIWCSRAPDKRSSSSNQDIR